MAREDDRRHTSSSWGFISLVDLVLHGLHKMICDSARGHDGDKALLLAIDPSRRPTITLAYSHPRAGPALASFLEEEAKGSLLAVVHSHALGLNPIVSSVRTQF
jgi:hypothetical protein